ncbi:MAG: YidB family protein [Burkholderiaceae bacterium]
MGLFDSIAGQVGNALSRTEGGEHGGLMETVMGLINNPQSGGIQGLMDSFKNQGVGGLLASWIGNGENQPISAEQIQSVLGSEKVQAIADKLGISTADASAKLAGLLPQVIDKLTPNGQVPEGGLLEQGMSLLKGFSK